MQDKSYLSTCTCKFKKQSKIIQTWKYCILNMMHHLNVNCFQSIIKFKQTFHVESSMETKALVASNIPL